MKWIIDSLPQQGKQNNLTIVLNIREDRMTILKKFQNKLFKKTNKEKSTPPTRLPSKKEVNKIMFQVSNQTKIESNTQLVRSLYRFMNHYSRYKKTNAKKENAHYYYIGLEPFPPLPASPPPRTAPPIASHSPHIIEKKTKNNAYEIPIHKEKINLSPRSAPRLPSTPITNEDYHKSRKKYNKKALLYQFNSDSQSWQCIKDQNNHHIALNVDVFFKIIENHKNYYDPGLVGPYQKNKKKFLIYRFSNKDSSNHFINKILKVTQQEGQITREDDAQETPSLNSSRGI